MKLGNNNNKNLPWKTNKPSKEWYMRDLCALYMSQSYEVYTLYMWQSYEVYTVYMWQSYEVYTLYMWQSYEVYTLYKWQSYEVYTVYMWQSYEVYTLYKCNNHTQLTHTLYTKCNFFSTQSSAKIRSNSLKRTDMKENLAQQNINWTISMKQEKKKKLRLKLLFHWRHQSRTNTDRYIDLHVLYRYIRLYHRLYSYETCEKTKPKTSVEHYLSKILLAERQQIETD